MIINKLKKHPNEISFEETITFIDSNFEFTPCEFINGEMTNKANQNNASCKIFSFAKISNLSKNYTLQLFGNFYRIDVLSNPIGTDHQNIRNFIKFGWKGIKFEQKALKPKLNILKQNND